MHKEIKRASTMMRIAAGLIDLLLLAVVIWGVGLGTANLFDTQGKLDAVNGIYEEYGQKYNIDFNITEEEASVMTEEELDAYYARYEAAVEAMEADKESNTLLWDFGFSVLMVLLISILCAHLLLELLVPLLLKNGQTIGKKLFGVALMRKSGIRVSALSMFVRSILGKGLLEIFVPSLVLGLMLFGVSSLLIYPVLILAGVQICLLAIHPNRALIHDLIAGTVAVDYIAQHISDSNE